MSTLNANEAKVLVELASRYSYEGFGYSGFTPISVETGLDRKAVRRACRSLARKGLAEFGRGLWTEDGEPAGSGYAATKQGAERAKDIPRPCDGCAHGIAEPPGSLCPGCEAYREHQQ
jgi:hypothetical protein